jgi:PhnB protein
MNEKGLIPHLVVDGAAAAIEFYKKAFGATDVFSMPHTDGKRIMHAQMTINGGKLMLADDFPEHHGGKSYSPLALGGAAITIHQNVDNCDAAYQRAIDAGATTIMAPADMFWGDRYAQVKDPFGHTWSFTTPIKK